MNAATNHAYGQQSQRSPLDDVDLRAPSAVDQVLAQTERGFELLTKQAGIALRSRYLNAGIEDDDQATTIAMIGAELGVPVMTAMRNIHLIPVKVKYSDGSWGEKMQPVISAALKHALARRKVPGFVLHVTRLDEKGCIVKCGRAGQDVQQFEWTVEDSRRAGLLEKTAGGKETNHVKYPKQMFLARCTSIAVSAVAPEATMGDMPTIEEVRDEQHQVEVGSIFPHLSQPPAAPAEGTPTTSSPQHRPLAEMLELLKACATLEDIEKLGFSSKPDRLALSSTERDAFNTLFTQRYVAAGGKPTKTDATKAAVQQAAKPTPPAQQAANEEQQQTLAPNEEPPASGEPAAAAKDDAPPPKPKRRTPDQVRADETAAEGEVSAQLDALKSSAEYDAWSEGVGPTWNKLSSAGKSRMRAKADAKQTELEKADALSPSGDRQPGDD